MKKITKLIIVALASILVSTAAFADDFDWSKCWCTYGGGLKTGDVIVDIGVGLPWNVFHLDSSNRNWFIPAVEASLEIPVMIWKLPFSFGGSAYYSAYGYSNSVSGINYKFSSHSFAAGGMAKYHVNLPPENLDVYAGIKVGIGMNFTGEYISASGSTTKGNSRSFYHSELLGASWYFSDTFGVNAEFGYPIFFKAGVSLKF